VDETLANTLELLKIAARTDTTIISTPIIISPDYRGLAESVGILGTIKESGAFRAGTPGGGNDSRDSRVRRPHRVREWQAGLQRVLEHAPG